MIIQLYKDDFIFVKVGKKKFILDAYKNGNLCFSPFEEYKRNYNFPIGDKNENIDFLYQGDNEYKLIIDGHELSKENGLLDAKINFSTNLKNLPVTHTFCCRLVKVNDKNIQGNKIFLPEKMENFGDYGLVIFKPQIFLIRVLKQISIHKNLRFFNNNCFGEIKYKDFKQYSGEIGPFVKDISYKDQNEYRISFGCNSSKKEFINIGSMKDIAIVCYKQEE